MLPVFAYRKLYPSLREHRLVEADVRSLLAETLEERYIAPQKAGYGNPLAYAQRHFFSILFLSIYRAIGIPAERRQHYGLINHCLRGIVTGADNLLDNEYKELLPLDFPAAAVRFKSVMHILVFDRFLYRAGRRMQEAGLLDAPGVDRLHDALFRAIVPIGAEEAGEEGGVGAILTPQEILSSVHMYKGGKLLCLSFVAPRLLEREYGRALLRAEQGIYSIGLALQIIDDLTDFYEDIRAGNHNYLVSSIFHGGGQHEREKLRSARRARPADGEAIEKAYSETVRRVMAEAIGEALHGFALLEEAGYWFNREQALALIRNLFILRGVRGLLPFFPEDPAVTELLHHAAP
ncbi:MAG: class 1 isoprenoid biosynthesis enzyme [Thermodesulfobacteriota bacterium]